MEVANSGAEEEGERWSADKRTKGRREEIMDGTAPEGERRREGAGRDRVRYFVDVRSADWGGGDIDRSFSNLIVPDIISGEV